jgi:DNA repair protein RadA/Sms
VTNLDAARVAMLLAVLARDAQARFAEQEVYAATVGGITAAEPAADLAIALALLSALTEQPLPTRLCAIGEVSLSGDIRRVPNLHRRLAEADRLGFPHALVPAAHRGENLPAAASAITTLTVGTLTEALLRCGLRRIPNRITVAPSS